MSALPVRIVRPKVTSSGAVAMFLEEILGLLIRGLLVMLLLPVVGDFHPSFRASLAACVVVTALLGDRSTYRVWTVGER